MEQRQLVGDQKDIDIVSFHGRQAQIWTAIPGIIQAFDVTRMTCTVQPSIMAVQFSNKNAENINLPLLVDCPIQFPSGGGCTLTFPILAGDECLVVFSSRCIDAWWQQGGIQPQAEMRLHDLSDGFVLLGVRSLPKVAELGFISTNSVQLRTDDGLSYIDLNPTTHNVTIVAPLTTINGDVQVNGTLTASTDVIGGGKSLKTHKHGGVTTGAGQTGVPV
jgi:hypothetical protein